MKPEEKRKIFKGLVKKRWYRINRNKKFAQWEVAYKSIQEKNDLQQKTEFLHKNDSIGLKTIRIKKMTR